MLPPQETYRCRLGNLVQWWDRLNGCRRPSRRLRRHLRRRRRSVTRRRTSLRSRLSSRRRRRRSWRRRGGRRGRRDATGDLARNLRRLRAIELGRGVDLVRLGTNDALLVVVVPLPVSPPLLPADARANPLAVVVALVSPRPGREHVVVHQPHLVRGRRHTESWSELVTWPTRQLSMSRRSVVRDVSRHCSPRGIAEAKRRSETSKKYVLRIERKGQPRKKNTQKTRNERPDGKKDHDAKTINVKRRRKKKKEDPVPGGLDG